MCGEDKGVLLERYVRAQYLHSLLEALIFLHYQCLCKHGEGTEQAFQLCIIVFCDDFQEQHSCNKNINMFVYASNCY